MGARPAIVRPLVTGFDPTCDAFIRDPGAAWDAARSQAPVFFHEPLQMWVITTHDDVEWALSDFRALSHTGMQGVPVPAGFRDIVPEGFFADSWIALDPPEHTEPRRIAQRGFTRPRIAALEPVIAATAERLIDAFIADGECELMSSYCYALTIRTLLALMGLPADREEWMRQLGSDHVRVLTSAFDPIPEAERDAVWTRYAAAWRHLQEVVDERIDDPGDDIISLMASAPGRDGRPFMARDRVVLHVIELAFAGTDTTANLIANAVVFLDAHPEQLRLVREDPRLWPAVVEETLRRRPSVQAVPRLAMRDIELGEVTIPAGSRVWLALGSAGNDPAHHREPQRFDVARERPDDHVSFGRGRHFCMGAPLARAQGRIGLAALYARIPAIEVLAGHELDFGRVAGAPSRISLPVRWS